MEYGKVRFFDLCVLKPVVAIYLALGAWSFINGSWLEGGVFVLALLITLLVIRNISKARVDRAAQTAPSFDTTGVDFEGYIIARNAIFASFPLGGTAFICSWHGGYRYMAVLIGLGALVSFPALVSTLTAYAHKRRIT